MRLGAMARMHEQAASRSPVGRRMSATAGTPVPGLADEVADAPEAELSERDERSPSRLRRVAASPAVLGLALAVLAMNLATSPPAWGIDSSFRVALTEATLERQQFGVDIVWPYGPLGFLGGATLLHRGLLAAAILYQLAALVALFSMLIVHLTRLGASKTWVVLCLAPVALALSVTDSTAPELVTVVVIVVLLVLWQCADSTLPAPTDWWVLALTGFVSGIQLLVKIGPGAIAVMVVVVVALSAGLSVRRFGIAIGAVVAGFAFGWLVTGQPISTLDDYVRTSRELISGYQDAQAFGPWGATSVLIGGLALAAAVLGAVGSYRWVRTADRRPWVLLPTAIAGWFLLKQGLVRWDAWHAATAMLLVIILVLAIRWDRRMLPVPLALAVVCAMAAFTVDTSRLRTTWAEHAEPVLALLSGTQRDQQLETARRDVRAAYDVPDEVIDALTGLTVHAEPWDLSALWAYDLARAPLPVLQSYSTYTAELDDLNATRYASADGPEGVLFTTSTVDSRYGPWESPAARVALTCNFAVAAEVGDWAALQREPNACGTAQELETVTVPPGTTVDVPQPTRDDVLVVAHFDLPTDRLGALASAVARPLRYARVLIDGVDYRLVTGTAPNAHLIYSPGQIGDRRLPHGPLDISTLGFRNTGPGDVVVRFEEVPLSDVDSGGPTD